MIRTLLEAITPVSDPFHVPPFVPGSVFYGTRPPVDLAMEDVAVLQAGWQCNESAARALKCLRVVVEVLGLLGVLDAKAHVDAVVALIEKRVVLANYAMAVGAVT
ncbi:hypothetical protein D3C71_1390050 [compost metagenome]